MRVLFVHGRYRTEVPSGENNVVDQESSALRAAGHDVELFQRHSDDISGWPLARKAALPGRSVWNGEVRRDLTRQLRRFRPDVVHVHNTFPLLSPSVLYACRDVGVPAVATLHNYRLLCASGDFFRDGKLCHDCVDGHRVNAMLHGCYRGSRSATLPAFANTVVHRSSWQRLVSAYIFISASQRDLMRGLQLPVERVFVKHNLVPPLPSKPREPEHLVVYLGRMYEAKGLPFLMQAWDLYRAQNPRSSLRLVLAGGGPMDDEVRAWAARHTSAEMAGLLPPDRTAELLSRALAAVVPSQWQETFGLVAVEAMAAGVAPVAAARGSFPELVTDGVDGALFPPDDPGALARILDDIDRRPQEYLEYGRQGRITYEKRFHPEANLEELLAIYRFAMKNPAGGLHVSS
jgi:glycosyltransferase involved in cell wall biosynthesis